MRDAHVKSGSVIRDREQGHGEASDEVREGSEGAAVIAQPQLLRIGHSRIREVGVEEGRLSRLLRQKVDPRIGEGPHGRREVGGAFAMNGARDYPQASEEGKRGVTTNRPQAEAPKAAAHPPEGHVERLRVRVKVERDLVAAHGGSQPRDGVEGRENDGV
jgi:hypothetical protein